MDGIFIIEKRLRESRRIRLLEVTQEFSSADTSLRQIPALFKSIKLEKGSLNLDYGGGKYDDGTDYLVQTYGVESLVYDPFNRSDSHNSEVLAIVRENGGADTVTCANVLNVIKEPEIRQSVIKDCKKYLKAGGTAYFSTYEGDGSGRGGPTPRGYQLNLKTKEYVPEISQVFSSVIRKGKTIIAK